MDRQTDRQTGRKTVKQTDRETDRQIHEENERFPEKKQFSCRRHLEREEGIQRGEKIQIDGQERCKTATCCNPQVHTDP